ncbi:MAG: DUF3307 domain-containing protein [Peptococcaceae bacterium]|jgi:hypothetical protein|nr:DUF3307 domain-containing protein [Peptococcaceae bacterium]
MNYLIGHLVGDYLLQTKWQAAHKKAPGLTGWSACLVHCSLWTMSVLFFTGWWKVELAILVFVSHLILDRTHFVSWFLKVSGKERDGWLVIVIDNTIHLLFLWLIAKYAA